LDTKKPLFLRGAWVAIVGLLGVVSRLQRICPRFCVCVARSIPCAGLDRFAVTLRALDDDPDAFDPVVVRMEGGFAHRGFFSNSDRRCVFHLICVYDRREKTAAESKPPIAIAKKRAEVSKSDFFITVRGIFV